jgi:hypothetical protein
VRQIVGALLDRGGHRVEGMRELDQFLALAQVDTNVEVALSHTPCALGQGRERDPRGVEHQHEADADDDADVKRDVERAGLRRHGVGEAGDGENSDRHHHPGGHHRPVEPLIGHLGAHWACVAFREAGPLP